MPVKDDAALWIGRLVYGAVTAQLKVLADTKAELTSAELVHDTKTRFEEEDGLDFARVRERGEHIQHLKDRVEREQTEYDLREAAYRFLRDELFKALIEKKP